MKPTTSARAPRLPDTDFVNNCKMVGWNLSQVARALGVHRRTVGRWASGEDDIPPTVERIMWLLVRAGDDERQAFLGKFGGGGT